MDCFSPALNSSLPMPKGSVGTEPGVWRTEAGTTAICLKSISVHGEVKKQRKIGIAGREVKVRQTGESIKPRT